jgi:hypothetical protein
MVGNETSGLGALLRLEVTVSESLRILPRDAVPRDEGAVMRSARQHERAIAIREALEFAGIVLACLAVGLLWVVP